MCSAGLERLRFQVDFLIDCPVDFPAGLEVAMAEVAVEIGFGSWLGGVVLYIEEPVVIC